MAFCCASLVALATSVTYVFVCSLVLLATASPEIKIPRLCVSERFKIYSQKFSFVDHVLAALNFDYASTRSYEHEVEKFIHLATLGFKFVRYEIYF